MYIYIIYVFEYPYLYPFFVYLVSSFTVSCCDRTHGAQNPS